MQTKKIYTYYPKGNFQALRSAYFQFRAHCKRFAASGGREGIDYRRIKQSDAAFLRHEIGTNPEWTAMQAFRLRGILSQFQKELDSYGIHPESAKPSGFIEVSWASGYFSVRPYAISRELASEFRKEVALSELEERHGIREWRIGIEFSGRILSFCAKNKAVVRVGEEARARLEGFAKSYRYSYGSERVELDVPLRPGISLRDYQTVGVAYQMHKGRCLNADTMGLGKTIQAIASMVARERFPALIVCPKSLRLNWIKEIHQFSFRRAVLLDKRNVNHIRDLKNAGIDLFVTNYEGVYSLLYKKGKDRKDQPKPALYEFRAVVFDEAHELKNRNTRKFKTCLPLAHSAEDALLMTGTPIVNKAMDIWPIIQILRKEEEFGGYKAFKEEYGHISAGSFNASGNDAYKLKKLNNRLRTSLMIRREKHEVLKELPPKSRIVLSYQQDDKEAEEYGKALGHFKEWAREAMDKAENKALAGNASLTKLNELGKLLAIQKAKFIGDMASSIIRSGEQVVIFAWHLATIAELKKYIRGLHEISGNIPDGRIEQSVRDFQAGKVKALAITYKRGSMGLTLTKASKWIAAEMGWTAKDQEQAEDRIHRIGQTLNVECYYPIASGTVDEYRYQVIESKKKIFAGAVDSKAEKAVTSATQNAMAILDKILAE